jgi:hypothetical protein
MVDTLIVNLFAGPGAGKSTASAYIFSKLKMAGINSEYVTEFAKDKTWEENQKVLNCQFYISGKQAFRLARVYGKVDVAVTDSPIILGAFYTDEEHIKLACLGEDKKYKNQLNYFIVRKKPYNPAGRNQTEDEAKVLDSQIRATLDNIHKQYVAVDGTIEGYDWIVNDVLAHLQK